MKRSALTFLALHAFSAFAHGERFGDRFCKEDLCVSAVYDDQTLTVKYTAAYSGKIGWVGVGSGSTTMVGANMMVGWPTPDGQVVLSHRITSSHHSEPTSDKVVPHTFFPDMKTSMLASDPTVAVFAWTFNVAADFASAQTPHIWALSSVSPHSNDPNARLHPHDNRKGVIMLDFTKPISGAHPIAHNSPSKGSTPDDPAKSSAPNTSSSDSAPAKAADIPKPDTSSDKGSVSLHTAPGRDMSDHSVRLLLVHMICMSIAWMGLMVAGILIGRFRVFLPDRWLKIHRGLQLSALALILFGFACAFEAVHSMRFSHFVGAHGKLGLVMVVLVMIQASLGQISIFLFKRKGTRIVNLAHLLLGIVLFFVLALWQIRLGFHAWKWGAPSWVPNVFFPVWFSLIAVLFFGGLALLPYERRSANKRRSQADSRSESWPDHRLEYTY